MQRRQPPDDLVLVFKKTVSAWRKIWASLGSKRFRERRFWAVTILVSLGVLASYEHKTRTAPWVFNEVGTDFHSRGYYNYAILADAFRAGQLHLLQRPDPRLATLPNPYDPAARRDPYIQDLSYYKGKLFLYYTPVPVLIFFLPYYALRGKYPSQGLVLDLQLGLTFLFLAFTLFTLYGAWLRRNLPLWAVVLLSLGFANGSRIALDNPTWYTLAVTSGALWVSVFLFACARVFSRGPTPGALLAAASSLVLAAWSRPHLSCLLLIPGAWLVLDRYRKRFRLSAKSSLFFLVPLFLGALVVGTYNYRRFENPAEFGLRYVLTVKDEQAIFSNMLGLKTTFNREFHTLPTVLFRLPARDPATHRWVATKGAQVPILPPGDFLHWDPTIGLFILCPLILLAGFVFSRRLLRATVDQPNVLFGYGLVSCGVLLTLFLGNVGCVAARYTIDVLPCLLTGALVVFLEFHRLAPAGRQKYFTGGVFALGFLSVWINLQF